MSRKHYFVIVLILLVVLAASTLLVPSSREYALMLMKDKHFEEARQAYESQLESGTLTVETTNHLTELYLQTGEIDKAIEVLEEFVKRNPAHADARIKLGTLYQYAQRPDDYLRNLEELNKLSPQPETLETLSNIYNFGAEYEKQAETLQKLIESEQGKNVSRFVDLANIQAAQQDYDGAIATLRGMREKHPDKFTFKEEQLLIWLLLDNKQHEEAAKEASAWLETNRDPAQGAQLVNILHFKGNATLGTALIGTFSEEEISSSPALLEEYVLLMLSQKMDQEIYAYLKGLYEENRLPPSLHGRLLFLAAERGDTPLTHKLLESGLEQLSEQQVLALVELSLEKDDKPLLEQITRTFTGDTYDERYPMLMTALAFVNKTGDAGEQLARMEQTSAPGSQWLQVANICVRLNNYACADHVLDRLPDQDKLTDSEVARIGELYFRMKRWDTGYAFLQKALETRESLEIEAVALQYQAVRGEDEKVTAWLEEHGAIVSPRQLADLYFTMINNKHTEGALKVAQYFHTRTDSTLSRSLLANAYVKTGRYEEALELLRQNTDMSEDDENNYLMALAKLAATHKEYRQELSEYAGQRLSSQISERQKMSLIYALVAAKQTDIAMPYIRELALSQGGEWASLYAETLDKQGRYEEARRFWLQVADQPRTSVAQRRSIAFSLLERGYKADAEKLFMRLAAKAGPDSRDVRQLLYLWGPRPDPMQMKWLEARYQNAATAKEKQGWAKLIAHAATPDFMQQFVAKYPESLRDEQVTALYLQALADEGSFADKQDTFIADARESGDIAFLREYARFAEANGFRQVSRNAYKAIVELAPADQVALRDAGLAAFDKSTYSESARYLGEYLQQYDHHGKPDPEAYRAHYTYGELLRRDGDKDAAQEYYHAAVALVDSGKLTGSGAQSVKAQSLAMTGDAEGGLKTYDAAMAANPNNDVLRADKISTLIELKRYDDARAMLATPPAQMGQDEPQPLDLPIGEGKISGYTLLNNDTELLIQSKGPLDKQPALSPQRFKPTSAISYASGGYDTLLIAAQPGYKFRIDTSGPAPVITTVSDDSALSRQHAGQVRLRYELLSARVELETGQVYEASKRLNALLPEYEGDAQLLGYTANAENYGGNWQRAEQLLADARAIAPENEDIGKLYRDMRRLNAPHVTLDYEWLRRGSDREHITSLFGFANINREWQFGASLQHNQAKVRNGRRADGRVGNFSDDRQRGELFLLHHGENGQVVKGSLFANNDTAGVGGYYQFLNPLGQTGVTLEWHRPYWEYTEAVLDDATRDRFSIMHTIKPMPDLTISFGPNVNRYNVDSTSNVMTTAGAKVEVVYRLYDGKPTFAIGYGFDGEYDLSHKKGFDTNGNYTRLFPLESREFHFLSLNTAYAFNDTTYGELLVGYGFDRLGGHSPIIQARLNHEITPEIDAQIRGMYGFDTSNSNDTYSSIGGYFRWRF